MTSFEEKIALHIYPSKEEFVQLNAQNLNRKEICEKCQISESTYKKLRKYYDLPPKKRKVDLDTYPQRFIRTQQTLLEKYGAPGSDTRREFYRQNRLKQQKTCLEKYGVEDPTILPEFVDKRQQTVLEKYGVDNPMKSSQVQAKARQTDLEKYGTECHISAPQIQEKSRKTKLSKYGTEYPIQLPEIREKWINTNLERYGVPYGLMNEDVRLKGYQTMSQNGTEAVLSSSQQKHLVELFKGENNYLFGYYHIDCYLASDNIGVEYSGSGHNLSVRLGRESPEHFQKKEQIRKQYFKNHNIPILEFVSATDKLPSDEKLLEYLSLAKTYFQSNVLYCCINLDTNDVCCEQK